MTTEDEQHINGQGKDHDNDDSDEVDDGEGAAGK